MKLFINKFCAVIDKQKLKLYNISKKGDRRLLV